MNESTNEPQKNAVIKTLAIIGFIVALIFVAWLAVQAVRLVPVAFNTLSSIADGLQNGDESDFVIATGKKTINTGETLTISWTKLSKVGEYVFSYQCADGVVAEIRTSTGELSTVACDSEIPLAPEKNTVEVVFSSERNRFIDVLYMIGFLADDEDLAYEREGLITIVNPMVSTHGIAASGFPENNGNATGATTPDMTLNTGVTSESPAPVPSATASHTQPAGVMAVPVVTTTLPVSNPNGASDLAVTFIGVGTYNATTKTFTAKSSLDEDDRGALQFEVKNIGTKTSSTWYFTASLPTDPLFTYASSANAALKPNERQVVTLQFDNVSGDSDERIVVAVTGGGDVIAANNSFSKNIVIGN